MAKSKESIKSSKEDQILRKGSSFTAWLPILEGALTKENCLGNVFHDIEWEDKITIAVQPLSEAHSKFVARMKNFRKTGAVAHGIIVARLNESLRPAQSPNAINVISAWQVKLIHFYFRFPAFPLVYGVLKPGQVWAELSPNISIIYMS